MLTDLMQKQRAYAEHDGERFLDAVQNARLVANAERYYRIMYYGSRASWNLRDTHMFETFKTLLDFHGPKSRGNRLGAQFACWRRRGDGDVFARRIQHRPAVPGEFGDACYSIGFGTNNGTVAAASEWDGPMEIKAVRPALRAVTSACAMRPASAIFAAFARAQSQRPRGGSVTAATGTSDRRDLPAGDRTTKPLFQGGFATPIRRIHLVR